MASVSNRCRRAAHNTCTEIHEIWRAVYDDGRCWTEPIWICRRTSRSQHYSKRLVNRAATRPETAV